MKNLRVLTLLVLSIIIFTAFRQKPAFDLKASVARGKEVYDGYCVTCHMDKGEGIEGVYPPLAKSDFLMADEKRSITITMKGMTGEIKVNGTIYDAEMIGFNLTDEKVSDVLNYVRNSFGNKGDAIKPEHVKALRN